jgi:hypothetical protein
VNARSGRVQSMRYIRAPTVARYSKAFSSLSSSVSEASTSG